MPGALMSLENIFGGETLETREEFLSSLFGKYGLMLSQGKEFSISRNLFQDLVNLRLFLPFFAFFEHFRWIPRKFSHKCILGYVLH